MKPMLYLLWVILNIGIFVKIGGISGAYLLAEHPYKGILTFALAVTWAFFWVRVGKLLIGPIR